MAAGLSVALADLRVASAQFDAQISLPTRAKSTPMEEGQPSATALGAAIHRASHQFHYILDKQGPPSYPSGIGNKFLSITL